MSVYLQPPSPTRGGCECSTSVTGLCRRLPRQRCPPRSQRQRRLLALQEGQRLTHLPLQILWIVVAEETWSLSRARPSRWACVVREGKSGTWHAAAEVFSFYIFRRISFLRAATWTRQRISADLPATIPYPSFHLDARNNPSIAVRRFPQKGGAIGGGLHEFRRT